MDETPRKRTEFFWGVLLVLIGAGWLVDRALDSDGTVIPLLVGVAFLVGWFTTGTFGLLVPGGIVTGVGLATFIEGVSGFGRDSGWLYPLCIAAGFASITVLARRPKPMWPLFPAAGLSLGAAITFASTSSTGLDEDVARITLPASVIAAGLVVLAWPRIRAGVRTVLLVALGAIAVISLASAGPFGGDEVTATVEGSLPDLADRTVVVRGSDDVSVTEGPPGFTATVAGRVDRGDDATSLMETLDLEAFAEGDQLVLAPAGGRGVGIALSVTLPAGTDVEVESDSGDVAIELGAGRVAVRADSGDVSFAGTATMLRLDADSGDVSVLLDAEAPAEVNADSGDVYFLTPGSPAFDVQTDSGDIDVGGFGSGGDFDDGFRTTGDGPPVVIRADSGDVTLVREERS